MEIMKIPKEKALRSHRAILAYRNYLVQEFFNSIELAAVFAHLAREKEAPIG